MKKIDPFWKRKKRVVPFNPDRTYLQRAIEEYLVNGGQISVVTPDEKSFKAFVENSRGLEDVDGFLLGS